MEKEKLELKVFLFELKEENTNKFSADEISSMKREIIFILK